MLKGELVASLSLWSGVEGARRMIGYVGKTAKFGWSSWCVLAGELNVWMERFTNKKWSSFAVQPMLLAKRRTSRFSHVTSYGGYSNPAPGPLILIV
jgi:hypothetical protein